VTITGANERAPGRPWYITSLIAGSLRSNPLDSPFPLSLFREASTVVGRQVAVKDPIEHRVHGRTLDRHSSLSFPLSLYPSGSLLCPAFGIRRCPGFADTRRNPTRSVSLPSLLLVPPVCSLADEGASEEISSIAISSRAAFDPERHCPIKTARDYPVRHSRIFIANLSIRARARSARCPFPIAAIFFPQTRRERTRLR